MIVVWGSKGDPPIDAVLAALERARAPYFFVDQRRPLDATMELVVDDGVGGWLAVRGTRVDLSDVRAVYLRPHDPGELAEVRAAGPTSALTRHAYRLHDALRVFTEIGGGRVVHRLSTMASNSSKPDQARRIRDAGFAIPETLLTTDPSAVRELRDRHPHGVIYKSVSGVRSVVARLTDEKLARLDDVRRCPTQFQELVPGVDHRVHVIGDDVVACALTHDAVDYRVSRAVKRKTVKLPPEIHKRCQKLAKSLGLILAGIDLRRTDDGRWYCFEVNPTPAFTYYELKPGELANRVARLLHERHP